MSSSDSDDCYSNRVNKLQKMKNNYQGVKRDHGLMRDDPCTTVADEDTNSVKFELDELNSLLRSNTTAASSNSDYCETPPPNMEFEIPSERVTRSQTRKSGLQQSGSISPVPTLATSSTRSKRGGRRGRRVAQGPVTAGQPVASTRPPRGRERRRARGRRGDNNIPYTDNEIMAIVSIGNTDEYLDTAEDQMLFSTPAAPPVSDDVVLIEDGNLNSSTIEEAEELLVKVYWQNREYFKFTIRRFQKLTQIFEFFSKKENVGYDKLYFSLGNKIIKPNDTPDSIGYSIVKFIEGGITSSMSTPYSPERNSSVCSKIDGICIKFQSQHVKKPFETTVGLDQTFKSAMLKCKEYFNCDKLSFYFDGELINKSDTPRTMEMEGGECIDVKYLQ